MTIAVDLGRKAAKQTMAEFQIYSYSMLLSPFNIITYGKLSDFHSGIYLGKGVKQYRIHHIYSPYPLSLMK